MSPSEVSRYFNKTTVAAAFHTEEKSVATEQLALLLREAIAASPHITFVPQYRVKEISRQGGGFRVSGQSPVNARPLEADQVVNSTWDSRAMLDQQLGINNDGLLYRLKYRTIAKLPAQLHSAPSATMVLGKYGDVVIRPDQTAYLSWYPSAMRGWSQDLEAPQHWQAACQGQVTRQESREIAQDMMDGISRWYPDIAGVEPILVDAGIIVAIGDTDIDDQESTLHQRSRVGITSIDGYHSLDAGKLTTAPMFAQMAARKVLNA